MTSWSLESFKVGEASFLLDFLGGVFFCAIHFYQLAKITILLF
jgi:hypothetical protein